MLITCFNIDCGCEAVSKSCPSYLETVSTGPDG